MIPQDNSNWEILMVMLFAVCLAIAMHWNHQEQTASLTAEVDRREVMSRHEGTMDFAYWQAKQEWLQREQR